MEVVTVAQKWRSFRSRVMHPDSPPDQVREMRRAFYAGAAFMLGILANVGEDRTSMEQGCRTLDALADELERFANDVVAGRH